MDFNHLLALITPDPVKAHKCRQPTCMGSRGYHGIEFKDTAEGAVARPMICCGRIGHGPYAELYAMTVASIGRFNEYCELSQKLHDETNQLIQDVQLQLGVIARELAIVKDRVNQPLYQRIKSNIFRSQHAKAKDTASTHPVSTGPTALIGRREDDANQEVAGDSGPSQEEGVGSQESGQGSPLGSDGLRGEDSSLGASVRSAGDEPASEVKA